jgi:hypothetical protein
VLSIQQSPGLQVALAPFSISQFPVFAPMQAGGDFVEQAAFVISNESDQGIIGVAVRWVIGKPNGVTASHASSTHAYLSAPATPLVEPKGRLLVTPSSFVRESILTSGGGIVGGHLSRRDIVSKFTDAEHINAEVDCIIFADGEVVGPDNLKLTDSIQDRQEALAAVLAQIHAARSKGEDPTDRLRTLAALPFPIAKRRVGSHIGSFVGGMLRAGDQRDSLISYLERMSMTIVKFYRKDVGL